METETFTFWNGNRRVTVPVVSSHKDASGARFVTVRVDGEDRTMAATVGTSSAESRR